MSANIQLFAFLVFAALVSMLGFRLTYAGKKRPGEIVAALGMLIAMFAVNAWHQEDKKEAAKKLGGALVILEDRIKAGEQGAALGIIDRGIRLFGAARVKFEDASAKLWDFAILTEKKEPNQRLEPTPTAVTSAAGAADAPASGAAHH